MGGCLLIYRLSVSFADRSPFLCFAFCELFTSRKRLNCNNGLVECKGLEETGIKLPFSIKKMCKVSVSFCDRVLERILRGRELRDTTMRELF